MTNIESSFDVDYMVVNSTVDRSAEVKLSGTTISDPIEPIQGLTPNDVRKSDTTEGIGNAGLIGGIIGAVAGLTFLGLLVVSLLRKFRQRSRASKHDRSEKYHRPHSPLQYSSRPFQVDLSAAEISPFTNGMHTYQDSPGDQKRSPPITGTPRSAFAFHPYQPGIPRSPVSSIGTTNLILGLGPVPGPRFKRRHDRQASISDIVNGMPQTAVTRAWTRTDEGTFGMYNQPRSGTTGSTSGSGSEPGLATAGTTSFWSPRPRGAQFSLPPLALPPKMFVLGQDGEVEPLGSPGGSGRSSIATKVG